MNEQPEQDTLQPWEPQLGEPQNWFLKFRKYAKSLGSDYTTNLAYLVYQHEMQSMGAEPEDTLASWIKAALDWRWSDRAHAWAEQEDQLLSTIYRLRKLEIAEEDWTTGRDVRQFALKVLKRMNVAEVVGKDEDGNVVTKVAVKPGELAQMLRTATELQRLAVNEPTVLAGNAESAVAIYLPSNERSPHE